MSTTVIKNIAQLVGVREQNALLRGKALGELPIIENAYLIIEDGIIADYGKMSDLQTSGTNTIDAKGAFVLPAWCDSHTHIVLQAAARQNSLTK